MHARFVIAIAVATAAMAPGYAQATGMFCEPGKEWTTVDSGTITNDGWSVVNFTKPEGGQMKVTWTYEDFDDGPATAGLWITTTPAWISPNLLERLYTSVHDQHASITADTSLAKAHEAIHLASVQGPFAQGLEATATLDAAFEDDSVYVGQYAAGQDADGWHVRWQIQTDNCLPASPTMASASGDEIRFLTADDFHGTLNAHARAGIEAPLGFNGATLLANTNTSAHVAGTPFLDIWWPNEAGDLSMHGPADTTLDTLLCTGQDATHCAGWGRFPGGADEPLTAGTYGFQATGFTDPTQQPAGATQGPYVTLVPTILPQQPNGEAAR